MSSNYIIDYSSIQFECPVLRKHLLKSKQYKLYLFQEGIVIGTEYTQDPKYLAPINLVANPIEFYPPDGFAILYNGKYRKFNMAPGHLEVLRSRMSGRIFFLNINKFYSPGPCIGKGVSSKVLKRLQLMDQKEVAVKMVEKQHVEKDKGRFTQFLYEIETLRMDNGLKELYVDDSYYYLVTEFYSGSNLQVELSMKPNGYPMNLCNDIITQLLEQVAILHKNGIMHRDISLQNIIINQQNQIHLIDFGMAHFIEDDEYAISQCGTPGYLAPEMANYKKGQKYNEKVDIFSIGCIYYKLINGVGLFSYGDNVFEDNKRCKIDFNGYYFPNQQNKELLQGMLQIDVDKRLSAQGALEIITGRQMLPMKSSLTHQSMRSSTSSICYESFFREIKEDNAQSPYTSLMQIPNNSKKPSQDFILS